MHDLGKTLMLLGGALLVVGAALHFGGRFLPLGHLPGDFHWQGENTSFHFPLMTSLLLSVVLTVLANLFFRR
ncbi:MAG: DUF2905 domain-containing protein [Schwartzia sp.]|nr:DUF2905 domain-containing protein [Schwartzia sp. (in: firmicutes)]